jgi:hypothetical protein
MRRAAVFASVIVGVSICFLLVPTPGQAGDFGVGVSVWLPPPPVIVVRPPVVYAPPAVYGYRHPGYSYYGHAPRYYRDHGYGSHRHRGWEHRSWRHNRGKDGPPPWAGAHGWRRKHGGRHD